MTDREIVDVVEVEENLPVETVEAAGLPATTAEMDNLRARFKLAQEIAKTDFVPASMRNKPAAVLACFMAGQELGLGPMKALENIYILDGRPFYSAELQTALVRAAGHRIEGEATGDTCTLVGTRADTGESMTVTWTLETALQAGLIDKIEDGRPVKRSNNGRAMPWELYPANMLFARAVTQLCNQLFADVLTFGPKQ